MSRRRLFIEYASQLVWMGANIADRILLTYLLIRFWGVEQFETWSIILSIASLISLFDFGLSLHFSNEITMLWEKRQLPDFKRALSVANSLFSLAALAGFACLAAYSRWHEKASNDHVLLPVMVLGLAYAAKIAVSGTLCLFRANQQYARLTAYMSLGEYARIGMTVLLCVAGFGVDAVAMAAALIILATQVVMPLGHAYRHFSTGVDIFGRIGRRDFVHTASRTMPYFLQSVPLILINALPVLVLGSLNATAGGIAAFVTVRTLTGMPRSLMQQSSVIFGLDAGRLLFKEDTQGLSTFLAKVGRFVSVSNGALAGLIVSTWKPVLEIWTSGHVKADLSLLLAGLLPFVFAAGATLTHNVLVSSGQARFAAYGRWLQLLVCAASYFALPMGDPILRMMASLSLGEVLGFSLVAQWAVSKLCGGTQSIFSVRDFLLALLAFVVTAAPSMLVQEFLPPSAPLSTMVIVAFSLIVCGVCIVTMGFGQKDRAETWMAFTRKLGA